jgi:hypothetical protein
LDRWPSKILAQSTARLLACHNFGIGHALASHHREEIGSSNHARRASNHRNYNTMKHQQPTIDRAKEILAWARRPGYHGGNPYGMDHVKTAEHVLAAHEKRTPDAWAGKPKTT